MHEQPAHCMSPHKDVERTLRIRENKRRSRERQREYIASLEKQLRQLQQEGVQATVEVQAAARHVAEENRYLRELCLVAGLSRQTVEEWLQRKRQLETERQGPRQQRCGMDVASRTSDRTKQDIDPGTQKDAVPHLDTPSATSSQQCLGKFDSNDEIRTLDASEAPIVSVSPAHSQTPSKAESSTCIESSSSRSCQQRQVGKSACNKGLPTLPPCKILTRLAAEPHTDIAQLTATPDDGLDPFQAGDEISCFRAHQLLMQYATSEEKLDAIAEVLENGCVPNAGPEGGCKIRGSTISQALLDLCL
ncbi:hypothetical protein A7D00_0985 [Trichophyton violaceum]|uniref:BZIP domain-containing protein n=1 Tax=Trichophyton violaceum TaxID=34388 RepID=A0A178FTZ7_TRIVO|nr:hypothetical protein A7D00_0985 [Trichophyton violaceum]